MTTPSAKFRRLVPGARTAALASLADKLLLLEALGSLITASLMIGLLSFKTVAAASSKSPPEPVSLGPAELKAEARRIRWALNAWADRVPWRAVCFQKGVAAQRMLRRRGIAATLFYGVAHEEKRGLLAHVWVRAGAVDVVGCENVDRYGLLGTFPGNENLTPTGKYSLDGRDNMP